MTGDQGYDVVVVLGQSNASGTNTDFDPKGPDARDPRIMTFPGTGDATGRIVPATEPLAPIGGHPPGGMGPGGPFAALLLTTLPPGRRILIVPATMGGTGFRRHGTYPGVWKAGLDLDRAPNLLSMAIDHLRKALSSAGHGSRVAAVLWQQGEADGGRSEAEYAADLDELIATIRQEVPEASRAPFLVGGLPKERVRAYPDHAGVDNALRKTPARTANTGYAEPPPLGYVNDGTTHLTAQGQRILGGNYFRSYTRLERPAGLTVDALRRPRGRSLRRPTNPQPGESMMISIPLSIVMAAAVALTPSVPFPASDHAQGAPAARELGRQVLADGDGWASVDGGTTGGANAAPEDVHQVSTRDELAAAVAGNEPKIVYVQRDINAHTASDGTPIICEDYAVDGYSLAAYLAAFDPSHWTGPASGPLEDARKASSANQREQIRINIGANTTIVGAGDVQLTGFTLNIDRVDNVIVRNLQLSDAYDCFPGWNGDTWKTEWDNLVVSGSTHVWLDHLTLDDGGTADAEQPEYFGEPFLRHDGLLDVVRQSDLVTISWSRMAGHDKSLLWGNGDSVTADRGRLRVTLHHNELVDLGQRAPRVRFGQAHVYNNVYRVTDAGQYQYSWGVGVESSIIAQNNTFELAAGIPPARIIGTFGGTGIDEQGTWVNGRHLSVLDAYNSANPGAALAPDVQGTSGPHLPVEPAPAARERVDREAGSGVLR